MCSVSRHNVIGNAKQRFNLHLDTQFFLQFAHKGIFHEFHKLDAPTGKTPESRLGWALAKQEKNLAVVQNHTANADSRIHTRFHEFYQSVGR